MSPSHSESIRRHPVPGDAGAPAGEAESETRPLDFIREIVEADLHSGKHQTVVTRFPPEPNGYLHIGHAKAFCISFEIARDYGGQCHLRFDDTNPAKESVEFVESIQRDIRWMGYDWGDHLYFASDYFEQLYKFAEELIVAGKAYVDSLSAEETREYRGTLTEPGRNSPDRDRPVEESLDLFRRMRAGEFPDGAYALRAKIDMASPNMNMRDPALYRIRRVHHHRTGDDWCIYPMYDFTHPLSDAIESITHSLCSLEFEDHRPLYDWAVANTSVPATPRQIEFARLALPYTVMSKRSLVRLVDEKAVAGWDDPRLPTLAGLRRRGYPPAAIREFCRKIGIAKSNSEVEIAFLEYCVREELNRTAPRVMVVLRPLKVVITNYPEGREELIEAVNNPGDEAAGTRQVPFSRELYIEQDDFMEDPPKKFFRLAPGREIRLKHAYYITCVDVIKDETGEVTELHCTYDPESRGGTTPDGRKVKGTSHWVSALHALPAEVRSYELLFSDAHPGTDRDLLEDINPDSMNVMRDVRIEPGLSKAEPGTTFQFLRQGYYVVDPDSSEDRLVFNRTVTLKDTWAKMQKRK